MSDAQPDRLSTGIAGLDEILSGGLLPHHAYLVRGGPGTGKTTLGLHFLAAATADEPALFITLEETEAKVRRNAAHTGLDLSHITFLDLSPSADFFAATQTYDIFSPAEVEREPVTQRIVAATQSLRPARVFLDPLTLEVSQLQQALLATAQSRLQLAVQAANIGLWDWDLATNRVYYAPEWKAQLGYADDEIGSDFREWRERVHPDDLAAAEERVAAYLARPWPGYYIDVRMRHKDGSYRWIRSQAALFSDEQGRPTHMLGAHVDLTEQRALEAEHQRLREQFYQAQKMDSIGTLAGGIAHDLNNLLVPIIGFADLAMIDAEPQSDLAASLDQIRAAGARATALTRQILAFSRRQMLEMATLDLNRIVAEFEKMLRRLIGEQIAFRTELAADLAPIRADAGQIEQVLLNLVVNARDAMPAGGTLTVTTANLALDEAGVADKPDLTPGFYVKLSVRDSGEGIAPDVLPRIFEPFFTTKDRGHGTGLGLSTAFGIVKQHQGHIAVESAPGQGSAFHIYLPSAPAATLLDASRPPAEERLGGDETVLVVEDDPAVRQLVCQALRRHGYAVLDAADAAAGRALAEGAGELHLLLTDLVLPAGSGHELYRRLAARRPGLRVLYMSGYANSSDARGAAQTAADQLLPKPFTIAQLLGKLRAALAGP